MEFILKQLPIYSEAITFMQIKL